MITTLVQKDSPSPVLLGTDEILSSLGFQCTFQTTNLLGKICLSNGNSDNHSEDAETQTTEGLKSQEEAGVQPDVMDQPMGELQLARDIGSLQGAVKLMQQKP